MKKVFAIILAVYGVNAYAQTPFEGKIDYKILRPKLRSSSTSEEAGTLSMYFSKTGFRSEYFDNEQPEQRNEIIIVNFDSAAVFKLSPSKKQYTITRLQKPVEDILPSKKLLLGFSTSSSTVTGSKYQTRIGDLFGLIILYVADSLFYQVPTVYEDTPELIMLNKGRIALSGEFYPHNYDNERHESEEKTDSSGQLAGMLFSLTATGVKRQYNDVTMFQIPDDYTKALIPNSIADTVSLEEHDSVVKKTQPLTPKRKKLPTKKNTNSKLSAIRRKEQ